MSLFRATIVVLGLLALLSGQSAYATEDVPASATQEVGDGAGNTNAHASDKDAVVAASVDDTPKKHKTKVRMGRQGIFGSVFGENDASDGVILTEDEGYWERFLQDTDVSSLPPTPGPACETDVTITCADSQGNDCQTLEPPINAEDCIEDLTYSFTVSNIGPVCMTIQAWVAEYVDKAEDGTESSLFIDLLPKIPVEERDICPGETYTVTETISTDQCSNSCFQFATEVEANPPDGGELCQANDDYEVKIEAKDCITEVEITCTNSAGADCQATPQPQTPADCLEPFTYCYKVTNIGTTCMDISLLERDRNGDVLNLVPLLNGETVICPTDAPREVCEPPEPTDLCTGEQYDTSVRVEANPPNGQACQAEDEYSVQIEAPCDVDIEIDCENAAGVKCNQIGSPETCEQDLTYTYCIKNTGATCMDVTQFSRTLTPPGSPAGTADLLMALLDQFGSTTICPSDTASGCGIEITELITNFNVCVDSEISMGTEIVAAPPLGDGCQADDLYPFSIVPPTPPPTPAPTPPPTPSPTPAPTSTCNAQVVTDCATEAATIGNSGRCDEIIPIITRCDERATFMEMLFNGGNCDQSFNIQESDKFDCTDSPTLGPPNTEGQYYLHVVPRKDPLTDVYFSGFVNVGDVFPMCPGFPSCSGNRFEADSTVYVFPEDPGENPTANPNWNQLVNYHTSCSQNLFLKDKFGSAQLVIFFNNLQGLVSCFITATFTITVTNSGTTDAAEITLFTNTVNGNTTDLTDAVSSLQPDETVIITTQILIDMTVQQDYIVTTDIVGVTAGSSAECSDSFTFTFTAGNNLSAPPGIVDPTSF